MAVTDELVTDRSDDGGRATVGEAVEGAGRSFEAVGRAGWVAKGLVYSSIGLLFLRVALDDGPNRDEQANQAGAVEAIAATRGGQTLLWLLCLGLALYALWRLFTVVLPGDWSGRALLDRGGYLVSTIVYAVLLATTVGMIRSSHHHADQREDRLVEDLVKDVLSVPVGRALVMLAGLVVIAVGAVFVAKGVRRSFRSELRADAGRWLEVLGSAGWSARGVSMGLVGAFLLRAGWEHDPQEAAGLDDSIRQLTGSSWGVALAVLVGIGFVVYGLFAGLSAPYRVLRGPRND